MVHARTLHIANGTSVTGSLDPVDVPGDRLIWCDPLHDGPVPGDVSDAELRRIRATFLAGPGAASADRDEILQQLDRADQQVAAAAQYDEVILWYEHDLFDQLNLIHLLDRLSRASPKPYVSLICIGEHPAHPRFKGLGELSATELTALLPQRAPVTEEQYASATAAWQAFRSEDPRAIERFLDADTGALGYLGAAMWRHLEEFPWTTTGLSRLEQRAVSLIRDGYTTTWELFRNFDGDDRAFYVTDTSLMEVLRRLATATPPLVRIEAPIGDPDGLPNARLSLSSAVANPVAPRPGIEKWLRGLYISGRGPTWRWDPRQNRLIHA